MAKKQVPQFNEKDLEFIFKGSRFKLIATEKKGNVFYDTILNLKTRETHEIESNKVRQKMKEFKASIRKF